MLDSKNLEMYVLGLRPWEPESDYPLDYNVKYLNCKDEVQLLEAFLKVFKALDPLIIYAWNGEGFDYPYLYNITHLCCSPRMVMSKKVPQLKYR